jgi:acetyltransferase
VVSPAKPSVLSSVVDARHIAIFGASSTPAKWGYGVVAGLLRSGYQGKLTLVNPRGGEVCGLPRVPAREASGADLAVIATPAATTPNLLRQCAGLGIPVAVVVAGGFGESGNAELDRELRAVVDQTGIRILGPNCLGVFVGSRGINTTSFDLPVGTVSAIAQSGGFVQHTGIRLAQLGGGFDMVVSLGNKLDLNLTDALDLVTRADTSSALMFYLERLDEGEGFLDAVAAASGTLPMIAIVTGRTSAGARAARSHTDSLIGRWDRVTGLLQDVGVQIVSNVPGAVAAALGGQRSGRRPLSRVFALCDGGSAAVLLADALETAGYNLTQPSRTLSEHLREVVGLRLAPPNPLDMQGRAEGNLESLLEASRAVVKSGEYDAVVLGGIFGGYARLLGDEVRPIEERIASELPRISAETGRPVVIQSMYATESSRSLDLVRAGGIACVEWPDEVVHVLNARSTARRWQTLSRGGSAQSSTSASRVDPSLPDLTEQVVAALDGARIKHVLGDLVVPGALSVRDGGSWVVRADGFLHKTASGAIRLRVPGSDLRETVDELARLSEAAGITPRIRVAPFIEHGLELVVTLWRDALEGAGCMIGEGGTTIERTTDVAIGRMPSTVVDVRRILSQTGVGQRLLSTDKVAGQSVVELIAALASMFRSALPQLRELECNPIAVADGVAVVLDALPSPASNGSGHNIFFAGTERLCQ